MNAWPFIIAAYALTAVSTSVLLAASFRSMRRAEAQAEALKGER